MGRLNFRLWVLESVWQSFSWGFSKEKQNKKLFGKSQPPEEWALNRAKTEDKMVRQHHRLNGHESEQTPGEGEGQEPWHAVVHGIEKSQDTI